MSDKMFNLLLTLAAIGIVCYGIFTMVNKDDTKTKKEDKQIKFDYDKELSLVDSIILDKDFKFNNETKLRIAKANITTKDIDTTTNSFNDVDYFTFTGSYIKASTMEKYLDDLFGNDNYELKSFYDDDYWYLYDKEDNCFYVFVSTLVTNCLNDVYVDTNCIAEALPKCNIEYSQDDKNIIANVSCIDGSREEYKDYDYEYSYKYVYSYNKKDKDYYISDIKLIKE